MQTILVGLQPVLIGDVALGIKTDRPTLTIIGSCQPLSRATKLIEGRAGQRCELKNVTRNVRGRQTLVFSSDVRGVPFTLSLQEQPTFGQELFEHFRVKLNCLLLGGASLVDLVNRALEKGSTSDAALLQALDVKERLGSHRLQ